MVKVVGIRFKKAGKIYYFDPDVLDIKKDEPVIVETVRGIEYGIAVVGIREVPEEEIIAPLKKVIRIASEADKQKYLENKQREKEAFNLCTSKIQQHSLIMKLIDVEYTFDNNKIIFYFTADGRVDFRDLVKDLAAIFKTRIELRQIGVRDEAKMIGGVGSCGRCLCCSTHLGEFEPVSIKMAKEQNLSLNPTKISGICGRLMCCLKYEQDSYESILKQMPKLGAIVETPEGKGEVYSINVLKETVRVRMELLENNAVVIKDIPMLDAKIIKQGRSYDSISPLEEVDPEVLEKLED